MKKFPKSFQNLFVAKWRKFAIKERSNGEAVSFGEEVWFVTVVSWNEMHVSMTNVLMAWSLDKRV